MRARGAIIRVPFQDPQLSRSTQLPSAPLLSVDVCGDSCANIVVLLAPKSPSPEMAEMAENPGPYAENYQSVSNAVYGGTLLLSATHFIVRVRLLLRHLNQAALFK